MYLSFHIVIYSKGLVAKDVGHTTVVQCIAESITNVPVEEMYETNSWYQLTETYMSFDDSLRFAAGKD